ncbi:hypothetical protein E1B28_003406 [Marasmius oreades]|uniref:Extracellular serine-rich protein n=1 Tax=Marasmius oreades TaxID=181124 RepID=A0A9P7RMZ9_9AGAR|nr:uncharacterized protein E1B28_003406 [Marasmius oreades]KAG7085873.1 hypothetical protein E1B28_003406 [Marasmius oreades]
MTTLLLPLLVFAFTGSGMAQVSSGTMFTIEVGRNGSFFVPDSVNARLGDTVKFNFFAAAHGVVQTSFENPCEPLPGGFSSGAVEPPDGEFEEWTLQITNTSTIWFYCPIGIPVPHCSAGMVGAINPIGEKMVEDFKSAAKAFNGTAPTPSPLFTGVGAAATETPVVAAGSAPPFQSDSSSTTSSAFSSKVESTSSSTSVPETSSSNHTPAIIGGTVAGLVALFATIIVVIILRRRRPHPTSRQGHHTVESQHFPPPTSGVSDTFRRNIQTQFYPVRAEDNLPSIGYGHGRNDADPPSSTSSNARALHIRNQDSQGNLAAGTAVVPISSERNQHQLQQQRHPYAEPGVNVDVAEQRELVEPGDGRSEDINALAKEVAAVLLRGQKSLVSSRTDDGSVSGSSGNLEGPPPNYKSRGHSTLN